VSARDWLEQLRVHGALAGADADGRGVGGDAVRVRLQVSAQTLGSITLDVAWHFRVGLKLVHSLLVLRNVSWHFMFTKGMLRTWYVRLKW
jgi:hypothetical protein